MGIEIGRLDDSICIIFIAFSRCVGGGAIDTREDPEIEQFSILFLRVEQAIFRILQVPGGGVIYPATMTFKGVGNPVGLGT